MRRPPYSTVALALGGIILALLGLYFAFLRPPLLPEDLRYMGKSLADIREAVPGFALWLRRVFWVTGGYMFATGVLTVYIAVTSFRSRAAWSAGVAAFSGIASIGLMAVVNFIIASDFRWVILVFCVPWVVALVLYGAEKLRRSGP